MISSATSCSLIRCGIALDAWMVPLDESIFPRVKQPIFFINSEKFQWAGNISRIRKLDSAVVQRKMITIRYDEHDCCCAAFSSLVDVKE